MSIIDKDDEVLLVTQADPTPGRQLLTKSERKKNIFFFTITSFFASSATSIHSLYFLEINDSEKLFGIIGTISSFVAIVGLILADYLNGILGYKRVFIIAQVLIAVSFGFFIFSPAKIYIVIIAVLMLSLAFSLNESPYSIILTESAGEERKGLIATITAFFGRFGEVTISTIVFILTFIIGYEFTNKDRAYFYLYGTIVVALIAIGIMFIITDPSRKLKKENQKQFVIIEEKKDQISDEEEVTKKKKSNFIRGFIDTFKDKWVLRVSITFFLDALLWGIALGVHWAGFQDDGIFKNAFDDKQISLLIMVTSITVLVAMYLGRYVDRFGARIFLFISELCGLVWIVLTVIFVFYQDYFVLMIIARIALGFSIALWIPSTISLFTNVEPERKSKVYNSIAIFRSIGWLPGGFIAGFLYDAIPQPYGYLTPMFIMIAGFLILIPVFYTLPNRPSDMNNAKKTAKTQ
ncbi:MAG: MFS transporter [Candidatus Heimdallarchaeota archaeon]|nr:MFS transporter [Candidatus Heimdallarchaeota archaeon]